MKWTAAATRVNVAPIANTIQTPPSFAGASLPASSVATFVAVDATFPSIAALPVAKCDERFDLHQIAIN
jgi:hypothetical protein